VPLPENTELTPGTLPPVQDRAFPERASSGFENRSVGPQALLPEPDAGPASVRAPLRVEVRDPATGLLEAVFEAGSCDITPEGVFFRQIRRIRTHTVRHAPLKPVWRRGLRMFPEAAADKPDARDRDPADRQLHHPVLGSRSRKGR